MAKIWVYAEFNQGNLQAITLELLAKARELGEVEVRPLEQDFAVLDDDGQGCGLVFGPR